MLVEIYAAASTIGKLANNPIVRDICKASFDAFDAIASDPLVVTTPWKLLLIISDNYINIRENNKQHSEIMSGLDFIQDQNRFIIQQNNNVLGILGQVETSLGALQTTTAMIGVGTFAGVALGAASLWQTLKLREDIKRLKLDIKDGFLDIKEVLRNQSSDIIKKIEEVAEDSKFHSHQVILIQAHGLFQQVPTLIKQALKSDAASKFAQLNTAQGLLYNALAQYDNGLLYKTTCAAGLLRRKECVWAIKQTNILILHLLKQSDAAHDSLKQLEETIRKDLIQVARACKSEEELAFIFPEILRIYTQDLPALQMQMLPIEEQLGYLKQKLETLPPAEQKAYLKQALTTSPSSNSNSKKIVVAKPREQELYEMLKEKTHYESLLHILKFIVDPHSRPSKETYIERQAKATGYQGFIPSNWEDVPHLTVANLYHYFKSQKTVSA